jgi:hypothetical protein
MMWLQDAECGSVTSIKLIYMRASCLERAVVWCYRIATVAATQCWKQDYSQRSFFQSLELEVLEESIPASHDEASFMSGIK